MRFETIALSIVTLTLVSCQNLDEQRSYLQPGERAVRISTSVWDRADLEDDLGVDLVDDFHAHELTIEHALNGRIGLYGGIGSRSYDLAAGPTERSREFTIGTRGYLPNDGTVHPYGILGLRYADLPESSESFDLDFGVGLVIPFGRWHLDLAVTRGLAISNGEIPFLDNLERNQTILMVGIGYSF